MTIHLREYQGEDFTVLTEIVRKTWHYDDFSSPEIAKKLAQVFLTSCLTNYTFSRVAVKNNQPVGIILANNKKTHKTSWRLKLQQYKSIASLLLSKEGRRVSNIFKDVSQIDKKLLSEVNQDYPAELALFAVDSTAQGKGVGKKLFQEALNYLNEEQLPSFYLFTDTSCNYGFYEHSGMIRRNEKKHTFHMNDRKINMTFFIYDYNL